MTTKAHRKEIQPFIDKCDKDGDPYLVVHFSRVDDYFQGHHERMDFADALLVIKQLVKDFKLSKDILIEML